MHKLAVVMLLAGSVAHAETKATVTVGTVQVVVGAFDTAAAKKVVTRAQAKLVPCVRLARAHGGIATAKIKLAIDGKVSSVTVTGLARSETDPVHNCIADALSTLKFAAPKDGAVVDLAVPLTFDSGFSEASVFGSLLRDSDLSVGGNGFVGVGSAGGGAGWGTIGTGNYGTIGGVFGRSSGFGTGRLRSKTTSVGEPKTTGDLDKAIIRRYLKRNVMKLEHCYTKELLVTPKLEGVVKSKFTISPDGRVRMSTATGLKNVNVETCVAQVHQGIEFPKPKSGEVVVAYPLIFKLPPKTK